MKELVITLSEARKIVGLKYRHLSDNDLELLIIRLDGIVEASLNKVQIIRNTTNRKK